MIVLAASAFGQASPERLVEVGTVPPVEMQRSLAIGMKAPSDILHLAVSLPFADPVGAQQFADAVSNPKSPLYRHFITPEQVGQRFGLPQYRVDRIRQYLESQGMSVQLVSKNRLGILVDATVAQAQAAFHTSIQEFLTPESNGTLGSSKFTFTTPPSLPAALGRDVIDIAGMESFTHPLGHTALTASQLRSVYSAASIYAAGGRQGAGRTIAISNFDGFRLSNIPLEVSLMSLPVPSAGAGTNVTVVPVSGGTGGSGTAAGEGDLDIQAVLGAAPLATVLVYDNYTTIGNNPVAVYTQEVSDNKADIITESYGWSLGTSGNAAAHTQHVSMTAQGITYMASSGDTGTTWTSNGYTFNYPVIEPEVLSIGGTSVTVSSSGARLTEVGWNSNGKSGGGGWSPTTDTFNVRPGYQSTSTFLAGAGVPSLASVPYRLVPDISFDADPNTGYLIYLNGSEVQIGGTSGASPTSAGLFALLEEQLIADGALKANSSGNYRLGRIQDLLYSYNGSSSVFTDITSGTNGTLPSGATSSATAGWDTDSGWGPVIFTGLLAQLEKGISSVTLSPSSVTAGASSTGTVTLQVAAPTGGAVVALSSSNTAAATVPASVTVAAGATTATFTVSSLAVTSTLTATITGTYNGIAKSATLSVAPIQVSSLTLSPTSVTGGLTSTATVTLSSAAPTGGSVVALTSNSASATVPATVTVAAGAKTATFTVSTNSVTASTTASIGASLGGVTASASLTIQTPALPTISSTSLSASTVIGGSTTSITGTVNISSAAPAGGLVVTLTSSSTTRATVPTSVTIAAGATSATFAVTSKAVTSSGNTTITATYNGGSKTVTLTVSPFALSAMSLSPASVKGGVSSTATVTLNATPAASTGAITVTLKSSSTSATVPASVSVAAGASTATFAISTKTVTKSTSVTLTSTLNAASKTAVLTITP